MKLLQLYLETDQIRPQFWLMQLKAFNDTQLLKYQQKNQADLELYRFGYTNFNKFTYCEKNDSLDFYFKFSRILNKLMYLELTVLISNETELIQFAQSLQNFTNLKELLLNLNFDETFNTQNISEIIKNIKYLENLEILYLIFGQNIWIHDNDCFELSKSIKQLLKLDKLHLSILQSNVQNQACQQLGQVLKELSNLKELHLDFPMIHPTSLMSLIFGQNLTPLKIRKLIVTSFCDQLLSFDKINICESNHLLNLQELSLYIFNTAFGENQEIQLGQSIRCMKYLLKLSIIISKYNIKTKGGNGLAEGIKYLINLTDFQLLVFNLKNLDQDKFKIYNISKCIKIRSQIQNNQELVNSQSQDISQIIIAIGHMSNLKNLTLNVDQELIPSSAFKIFGNEITKLKNLQSLNLTILNQEISNRDFHCGIYGLKYLSNFQSLRIFIDFDCLSILGEELVQFQCLRNQEIYFNDISIDSKLILIYKDEFICFINRISKIKTFTSIFLQRMLNSSYYYQNSEVSIKMLHKVKRKCIRLVEIFRQGELDKKVF